MKIGSHIALVLIVVITSLVVNSALAQPSAQGVVKSVNGLAGQVSLSAGPGITITPVGNGFTISAQTTPSANAWHTAGNAGTSAGENFLGTTDYQPLELKVNGQRAWRLEPTVDALNHSNIVNVIGGSPANFVSAGVYGATIAGGGAANYFGFGTNSVECDFGSIGGGVGNAIQPGAFDSTISGGYGNQIEFTAADSTISGGAGNRVLTGAADSTIGGGEVNTIQNYAFASTIAGGSQNSVLENATESTIGGGAGNTVQAGSHSATISGGLQNLILPSAPAATISGGSANAIGTNAAAATIGGGGRNLIQANAYSATLAGGVDCKIGIGSRESAIGGGAANNIQDNCWSATIGGGSDNLIKPFASWADIGGGRSNIVGLGADYAMVGGGSNNGALGPFSMIPGGEGNTANGRALAAGRRAKAIHVGSFVWADSTDADFNSAAKDDFSVRASGGTVFYSDANATVGVELAAGGNSWAPASDRNLKENFQPANGREVLSRVVALPIATYNMKTQDPSVRHIGPMAQDFQAAFGVGEDDKHIATVDADGVALAAIQGLNEIVKEKDHEIQELKKAVAELQTLVNRKLQTAHSDTR